MNDLTLLNMTFTKIQIQCTVDSQLQKAWDYYTQPEHLTKWNFASDDWHCPYATNEVKEGGKLVARMEAKDGSFGFDFEGLYKEVVIGEKLTYQMADSRVVQVQFKKTGDATVVRIVFDAETENPVDMQRDGWQAILNNFKRYTETH